MSLDKDTRIRPTPHASDVIVLTTSGTLTCYAARDGTVMWSYATGRKGRMDVPSVHKDGVLFFAGGRYDCGLYAIHLKEGTLVWRTPLPGFPDWIGVAPGGHVLVHLAAIPKVFALTPDSGRVCAVLAPEAQDGAALALEKGMLIWKMRDGAVAGAPLPAF